METTWNSRFEFVETTWKIRGNHMEKMEKLSPPRWDSYADDRGPDPEIVSRTTRIVDFGEWGTG